MSLTIDPSTIAEAFSLDHEEMCEDDEVITLLRFYKGKWYELVLTKDCIQAREIKPLELSPLEFEVYFKADGVLHNSNEWETQGVLRPEAFIEEYIKHYELNKTIREIPEEELQVVVNSFLFHVQGPFVDESLRLDEARFVLAAAKQGVFVWDFG